MGGVSVLLMFAAIGITYGWQPDNQGGVEYVIQIEPDQLHELARIGEISSSIDPAVRGHVSRIVVRVGNGPVPKITPPNLAKARSPQQSDVMVVSDHSPVPIPEMDDVAHAVPIPSLDSDPAAATDRSTAVMKPDANDPPSGSGFNFPSLPSSLRDGSASERREGMTASTGTTGSAALALPTTGAPSSRRTQAPQFTGSDPTGELARTRPGGPTTNPTNTRDMTWRNLGSGNEYVGPRTGGPSTDPVRRDQPSAMTFDPRTATAATNSPAHGASVSGLSPSDSFGRMPSALRSREDSLNVNPNLQTQDQRQVLSQFEQTQIDRQSQYSRSAASAGIPNDIRAAVTPAYAGTAQGNIDTRQNINARQDIDTRQNINPRQTVPDSRLTAAQIAAGAWSVDIYGRPIDRDGRLIAPSVPSKSAAPSDQGQFDRYADRSFSTLGQPHAMSITAQASNPTGANTFGSQSQGYPGNAMAQPMPSAPPMAPQVQRDWAPQTNANDPNGSFARDNGYPNRDRGVSVGGQLAPRDTMVIQREADPPSLSSRRSNTLVDSQPRVTAQPLFNGLLLISFVANVYLIFWLKNLRLQFRDLVAAKRMANSNSPAT